VKEPTRPRAARGRRSDLWRNEEGQGFAEYALILVLIAILSIIALTLIGGQISSELSAIGTSV
jgi:Flp pilus assembly pilin Flp